MVKTLFEKLICDKTGNYKFSISIKNFESYPIQDSLFWIGSDVLPEIMLEKFSAILSPKLIFEGGDDTAPDLQYLEELLSFLGDLVLKDRDFEPFFYPSFFLDSEQNVRPEVTRKFNEARHAIRLGKNEVFNSTQELHLFYFNQLLNIPKRYTINKNIKLERITRKRFETSLSSIQKAEEYVDIYFFTERFKVMTNAEREPCYFLALNKKNETILAIRAEKMS
jgi:hypothetical protein